MSKVYICGNKNNRKQFKAAEQLIRERGDIPINPLRVMYALPEEINMADFTIIAYELIRISDKVYCLDGWDKDLIARMEVAYAQREVKTIVQTKEVK